MRGGTIIEQNKGYAITRAILYDNDRGFAMGECPRAPEPFVTWRFTEKDGQRDYYWGRYFNTEDAAVKNFLTRTGDYERDHNVKIISEGPQVGLYKYYSTQRPVDLGTYPKSPENPMIGFINYDKRIPVEGGAFQAWGVLSYARPLTEKELYNYELRPARGNLDVRRTMDAQAQIVGQWEVAFHVPDVKRLTWFYSDFGSFVAKDFVTSKQLAACVEGIEAQRAARAYKEAKPAPIAEQLKTAEKLAGESRGQTAPKKDAPDKGDR